MKFIIGEEKNLINKINNFYLAKDTSLIYNIDGGDYSVLLGGNWRCELIVDSSTGQLIKFQTFLDKLKINERKLTVPKSKKKNIFFVNEEGLDPYEGCHYYPFKNTAYWDSDKKILCYGDPNIIGEAIEFTEKITVIIKDEQLICIYLQLDNIDKINNIFKNNKNKIKRNKLMNKYFKIFEKILIIIAVITIIGTIIMYWFPIPTPFSSYTATRAAFIAFLDRKYYLILISILICGLILYTAKSIKNNKIIPAILLLIYYIYELFFSSMEYFSQLFFNIPIFLDIYIIISLIIYLILSIKKKIQNKEQSPQ